MGNTSCVLGVQTEKSVYFCGEKVNGRVFLSVNDKDGFVAQTLNIHFSGKERAVVSYTEERRDDNEGTVNEDRYDQNEMKFLNFDVPINTPIGSLFQPGQYEFPFQFIIPQNLPSSMISRHGQSICEIRYEMAAYLSKNDRSSFMNPFNSNTISSKPLVLKIHGGNSPVSQYSSGPIHFPGYNHAVRNCFCCYRGTMDLRASIDSAEFSPNQDHKLSFELKNTSRVGVENVTVEVIERVHWQPRFHEETREFTLVKHAIDGRSHNNWMSMEQKIETTVQEYVSFSPTSRGTNPSYDVSLRIPNSCRDSYAGSMIQVEHFVRVKVVTRGCCVSNPETTVDINISRPSRLFTSTDDSPPVPSAPYMDEDQSVVEGIVLPQDWSPQTSDLVTLPLANVISSSPAGGRSDGPYFPQVSSTPLPTK